MNRDEDKKMLQRGIEITQAYEKRLRKRLKDIENDSRQAKQDGNPTACELACDEVVIAIIAKELACAPPA